MDSPTWREREDRGFDRFIQKYGFSPLPITPLLVRPEQPPTFRSPQDDSVAEDILKRQRQAVESQHSGSFRKAFIPKKKAWESREIYAALTTHVSNGGQAGVAEALIDKLEHTGGNVNAQKSKSGILNRRKSTDSVPQRNQIILFKAVENAQTEMVQVLLPHADQASLDNSLPVAIRNGNMHIVELLLRYGARAVGTSEGQTAFRHACATGGQDRLVAMILNSTGRPGFDWLSRGVIDAAMAGCLPTVRALIQGGADANMDNAAGLKAAIGLTRPDMTLAIIASPKPPVQPGINEAFLHLFSHQTINPAEKLEMAKMLLLAGAGGDEVANSLVQACKAEFFQMVQLLLAFRASIEYQDAFALRNSVKRGRVDIVHLLLSSKSPLSPLLASECVDLIPRTIDPESRRIMLDLLLRRGATGKCLHDALIDAADSGDMDTASLLLSPIFPGGGTPVGSPVSTNASQSMIFARHDVATVDYKAGHALLIAVNQTNAPMVKLMLSSKPSSETMAAVFPETQKTRQPEVKYALTEAFLSAGLRGMAVSEALQKAIEIPSPDRDEHLVSLFLARKPDINFNNGSYITTAVSLQDVNLLQALLDKSPSSQAIANALPMAMEINTPEVRLQIAKLLLNAGASSATALVSDALVKALQEHPPYEHLISLLLKQGKADINHNGGIPVAYAIQSHNPAILDMVLRNGTPSNDTLARAVRSFTSIPTSPAKATKLECILSRYPPNTPRNAISDLLIHEVNTALKLPGGTRSLGLVKALLAAGANVNMQNAAVLQEAVRCTDQHLVNMIFTASSVKPTPLSSGHALPRAMMIGDPMDRLVFTQRLLREGAPAHNANEALVYAVKTYPDDVSLLKTLIAKAEMSNGDALSTSIQAQNVDAVDMILAKATFTKDTLNANFVTASICMNRERRSQICQLLLKAGVEGVVISDALIAAASQGDLELSGILLHGGADVDYKDGEAIIASCRAGAAEVLKVLLGGRTRAKKATLINGFQAATEMSDLKKRQAVFKLLLERKVTGDVVNAQLVSSARFVEKGLGLVKLLLYYGADVNYNSGEAVWSSTRHGYLPTLELLLGIRKVGGKQGKPNPDTLTRALKASLKLTDRDTRYTITDWVFQAGLPVSTDIHVALNNLVNENVPDDKLIDLFLRNGASPLTNGCQSFVDATKRLLPGVLDMFMKLDIPPQNISWIFEGAFTTDAVESWFSREGLDVARTLLQKGAKGNGPAAALVTVIDIIGPGTETLAASFIDVFMDSGVDVDYENGLALQKAATRADADLIRSLLKGNPSTESISIAMHFIFALELDESDALDLIELFTDYHVEGQELDVITLHDGQHPVLFQALSMYPRSTKILDALLDAGYYHDQAMPYTIDKEIDKEEEVSLLLWALLQPQKKVSNSVLATLIEKRANPNFTAKETHTTPLMAAVFHSRYEIAKELLITGADATAQDVRGNTPLTLASAIGGDVGKSIMRMLLQMNPAINDGSLHTAAARLDYDTIELLLDAGHEPDFPSTLHQGRSALAELVLHAGDGEGIAPDREKILERVILLLLKSGSDPSIKSQGLSVLLLALHSKDPVPITKIVLKCGIWKYVNSPSHQYKDDTYIYSPTQYILRLNSKNRYRDELVQLLKNNRAHDVFYAHSGGPQPPDTMGLPAEVEREEKERRARLARIADAEEDHRLGIRRTKELAMVQQQVWTQQADVEDSRMAQRRRQEIEGVRERARIQDEVFAGDLARERARREAALSHESRLLEASVARADAERHAEEGRRRKMLEWDVREGDTRLDQERKLRAIRMAEREDMERIDKRADERVKGRISEQKRLIESQQKLAGQLQNGGMAGSGPVRRQIGFATTSSPPPAATATVTPSSRSSLRHVTREARHQFSINDSPHAHNQRTPFSTNIDHHQGSIRSPPFTDIFLYGHHISPDTTSRSTVVAITTSASRQLRKQAAGNIFLGVLALIFPPLPVWVKCGICSADSLINILLCMLGFLPGLLHSWYIIAKYPDPAWEYEPVPDAERASGRAHGNTNNDSRVAYVLVRDDGTRYEQAHGQNHPYNAIAGQPKPQPQQNVSGYGTQGQGSGHGQAPPPQQEGVAGPSSGGGAPDDGSVPPSYAEAVGDNKIQTRD
ncbi:hypothetical protein MKZ38_007267 [Zalerion maritima]|uniref:Uncharacterized protein n=1 Tax=Zalerion maritima TaxID=339359 RepID=A0AAD5WU94_9PEZI|nr:hypothetical protein MKZ38_007267 [Zalerion maritima]